MIKKKENEKKKNDRLVGRPLDNTWEPPTGIL